MIELLLGGSPVSKKTLQWDVMLTFAKNDNLVVELTDDLEAQVLARQWGATIQAITGRPFGSIMGVSIAKDAAGNRLVGADGLYVKGGIEELGNVNPDWLGGMTNTIRYKDFSFSFLIDVKKGGDIFSATNVYGAGYSGIFDYTLEGREEWYASEAARESQGIDPADWTATGGYLAAGVYEEGTVINGQDVSGQANAIYVDPKAFWSQFSDTGNEVHEQHVYDASFVKLRQAAISYRLPENTVRKLGLRGLTVSVVGRNLWLIHSNVPNIDPESAYNNGNGQGLEYGTYPVTRSIGMNVRIVL